jgi:protein-tyrosine-phosphatase
MCVDKEYWSFFINNFIKEKYRERLNYEFESVKKRNKAMGRFCHNAIEILRKDKIIYSSKKPYCFTKDQLKQVVLIVNMTNHIQGLTCLLDEALEIAGKESRFGYIEEHMDAFVDSYKGFLKQLEGIL